MFDESIGQAQMKDRHVQSEFRQRLGNRRTGTTRNGVFSRVTSSRWSWTSPFNNSMSSGLTKRMSVTLASSDSAAFSAGATRLPKATSAMSRPRRRSTPLPTSSGARPGSIAAPQPLPRG
jgi:hypothetical protein